MNKQFEDISTKINALSIRERLMVLVTIIVLLCYVWWSFFASPRQLKTSELTKQNKSLVIEIQTLDATIESIRKRINEGVHKARELRLTQLKQDLIKVKAVLKQKTFELIEPDEMFELMQQLIFSESKLKLTGMKRKLVKPVFSHDETDEDQPEIYRHVMQVKLEGRYKDILSYTKKLEELEWKLIWDRISLNATDYPVVRAEIEISTLSNNKYWVGL